MTKEIKEKPLRWDCESIAMFFYRNQHKFATEPEYKGHKMLLRCSEETGIAKSTIYYIIDAYLMVKTGEFSNWWLDIFANGIGYRVEWIGHKNGYIWVYKNTSDVYFSVNNIDTDESIEDPEVDLCYENVNFSIESE